MPKAYWVTTYRAVKDAEKVAESPSSQAPLSQQQEAALWHVARRQPSTNSE